MNNFERFLTLATSKSVDETRFCYIYYNNEDIGFLPSNSELQIYINFDDSVDLRYIGSSATEELVDEEVEFGRMITLPELIEWLNSKIK
jgi:hypothetical protein